VESGGGSDRANKLCFRGLGLIQGPLARQVIGNIVIRHHVIYLRIGDLVRAREGRLTASIELDWHSSRMSDPRIAA